PILQITRLEPLLDERLTGHVTQGFQDEFLADVVKRALDVRIHYHLFPRVGAGKVVDFLNGIMSVPPRTESVRRALESGFPGWFESVLDQCLKAAVHNRRDAERA